ncbi:hypothetical protein K4F52_000459 [Lecanicillium sp. MT-2017a]|nr:hypothetical protein K4F52_000459 [Lecanicillium sp. MT-2017a]
MFALLIFTLTAFTFQPASMGPKLRFLTVWLSYSWFLQSVYANALSSAGGIEARQDDGAAVCAEFPGAGPVNPGQTNRYPCDTHFLRSNFPCSQTGTRPCVGKRLVPWTEAYLAPAPPPPYKKKPVVLRTNYDFPVILSIVDTYNQAEHYVVTANGKFIGETGGETGYSNVNSCGRNAECSIRGPYTRGYFLIPAGMIVSM